MSLSKIAGAGVVVVSLAAGCSSPKPAGAPAAGAAPAGERTGEQTGESATEPRTGGAPAMGGQAMTNGAPITAKAVDMIRRRPPLAEIVMDVQLRNDEPAARWFIIPRVLPADGAASAGGVNVLEVQAFEGQGRAVVGRFLGRAGCYALLLPAGGTVRLQRLSFEYWEEPPEKLRLDLKIAAELTVGGEPARTWFDADPTSEARVDADRSKAVSVHRTPDSGEVPLSLTGVREVSIEVTMPEEK